MTEIFFQVFLAVAIVAMFFWVVIQFARYFDSKDDLTLKDQMDELLKLNAALKSKIRELEKRLRDHGIDTYVSPFAGLKYNNNNNNNNPLLDELPMTTVVTETHRYAPKTRLPLSEFSPPLIGRHYNWKHDTGNVLTYIGKEGVWHQFTLVGGDENEVWVWCEVLDKDLHMLEETVEPVSQTSAQEQKHEADH